MARSFSTKQEPKGIRLTRLILVDHLAAYQVSGAISDSGFTGNQNGLAVGRLGVIGRIVRLFLVSVEKNNGRHVTLLFFN